MKRFTLTVAAAAIVLSIVHPCAQALLNPNFTPIHVVNQSEFIAEVTFEKVGKGKDTSIAAVTSVIKGKAAAKTICFNFNATPLKDQARAITAQIRQLKDTPVLFFVGSYTEEGAGVEGDDMMLPPGGGFQDETGEAEEGEHKGYLHVNGQWVIVYPSKENIWEMDEINSALLSTWNGSTGMLIKAVRYVLTDPTPELPARTKAYWTGKEKVGTVMGRINGAAPVVLKKGTHQLVFVACEQGDKLYSYNVVKKAFTDITEKHGIQTCSKAFQWTDVNRDGFADLATWDGAFLNLLTQKKDGTFESSKIKTEGIVQGCCDISVTDVGRPGSIGLILSTERSPVLVVCGTNSSSRKLVTGPFPGAGLGRAGRCLVADFDGDNIPDIVQPFETGGLFYKGTKPGEFAQPSKCSVALGKGKSFLNIGDFDHDCDFDIFVVGKHGNRMWRNNGKGGFTDVLVYTGEIPYYAKPGGVYTEVCDINNDGRQDILIAYSHMSPCHFFNRGFHSFGHSHHMDLDENGLLPQAREGAQTGCMGDFNSDGAQDMVLVLHNGEVWVFFRETTDEYALAANVSLAPDSVYAGPLKVTGYSDERCIGSWNIYTGSPPAFFARRDGGTCKVTWTFPDGTRKEKEVILETKPVDVVINR